MYELIYKFNKYIYSVNSVFIEPQFYMTLADPSVISPERDE